MFSPQHDHLPAAPYLLCENSVHSATITPFNTQRRKTLLALRNLSFTLCARFTRFLRRRCVSSSGGGARGGPTPAARLMDYTGEAEEIDGFTDQCVSSGVSSLKC